MSDERLTRIEDKLDTVGERINSIDVTLAAQHESLKHHIKRTDILEKELRPVKKHVDMINGALKFIGVLAMIAAILEAIIMAVK